MSFYVSGSTNNSIFKTNEVTLAQLKQATRERSDMVNSNFISESELTQYINQAYGELYDLIVSRFEDEYIYEYDFTVSGSATSVPLPSDFYKLKGLDYQLDASGDRWESVSKFNFEQRNSYYSQSAAYVGTCGKYYRIVGGNISLKPNNNASGTYKLWYIPTYRKLVTESDTLSGVNGWEDYIIITASIDMLDKQESDTSTLRAQKKAIIDRIATMAANRDVGGIEYVTDVKGEGDFNGY